MEREKRKCVWLVKSEKVAAVTKIERDEEDMQWAVLCVPYKQSSLDRVACYVTAFLLFLWSTYLLTKIVFAVNSLLPNY